jgi:hypothetical protein
VEDPRLKVKEAIKKDKRPLALMMSPLRCGYSLKVWQ